MAVTVQFDPNSGNASLSIGIINELDRTTSDLDYDQFPIRIGRNRKNDLVLLHEYVSQWHAVIGFVGGQLSIVQVGRSNSVRVDGRKLATDELAPLAGGEEVRIYPFTMRLQLSGGASNDASIAEVNNGSQYQVPAPGYQPAAGQEPAQGAPPLPGPGAPVELLNTTGPFPLPGQGQPQHQEPDPGQGPHALFNQAQPPGPPQQDSEALAALGRIAERYWGRAPQGPQEAAFLAARVELVLDQLLQGFVSLRSGHQQFCQQMGVKVPGLEESPVAHTDPIQLGFLLLTAQDPRVDQGLPDAFEQLKMHQVALLRGLEAGVKLLLKKLGPPSITKLADRTSNVRVLWEAYCQIHGDLAEEGQRFRVLYGASFKKAYNRVFKRGS